MEVDASVEVDSGATAAAATAEPEAAAAALAGVASLADRQMEQLFQALPLHERKALGDWCRAQRGQPARPLYHNPQDKYDGQPHTWFVRTLDTVSSQTLAKSRRPRN